MIVFGGVCTIVLLQSCKILVLNVCLPEQSGWKTWPFFVHKENRLEMANTSSPFKPDILKGKVVVCFNVSLLNGLGCFNHRRSNRDWVWHCYKFRTARSSTSSYGRNKEMQNCTFITICSLGEKTSSPRHCCEKSLRKEHYRLFSSRWCEKMGWCSSGCRWSCKKVRQIGHSDQQCIVTLTR